MAGISKRLSFLFTLAIGIAYAGCNGPQQVSTPLPAGSVSHGASRPLPRSARRQPLLYISVEYNGSGQHNNAVDIFSLTGPHQQRIGSISTGIDGPWGLSVDANNSLYVANGRPYYNNRSVTVYPFGSSTPSMTYSSGLHQPLYAVADSVGHVFVSDREIGGSHPRGYVVEYKAGTNSPKKIVPMGSEADGMAFDAKGNLYVAYRRAEYGSSIVEFGPGLTNERHMPMTIEEPQGLLVDSAGNIVVVESAAARVLVYAPGARKPSVMVRIPRSFGNPMQVAMRNRERTLWVDNNGGQVFSMPYPLTPSTQPTLYDAENISSGGMTVTR